MTILVMLPWPVAAPRPEDTPDCAHDWEEEYYGTRCKLCGLFYPDDCAPWDADQEDDHNYNANDGTEGSGD